ncbi:MAG: hypothetical protein PV340_02345 [Wolbachia sp.]|nr:hypothetical protein [Wolbachia sp.]MDD9336733.1 hypothetical protein [Wolbachia sp.]
MRKIFIYVIVSLFFFVPIAYSGFWYFSAWKAKNFLVETISYANDEKFEISHDLSCFPFNFIFHIKNPKFSNEQSTVSSKALLVKNRLFDKSLYVYTPSNEVDIAIHSEFDSEKKNIKCSTNSNNRFIIKLKHSPLSLKFDKNNTIIDYINTFRYEDYGLKCDITSDSKNQKSILTEVNDKSNHIQFNLSKELNENAKLGFDFYVYRYKNIASPESYLSIDTKFGYEFVNDISASSINFDTEKFLIQSDDFSIAAEGRIQNYNPATSAFKDKINVEILNYKKLTLFMIGEDFSQNHPKVSNAFQKLIYSLSEKTTDDDIQFTIKYDNDIGSSFIGKLSSADFIDQISKINQLTKDEKSS